MLNKPKIERKFLRFLLIGTIAILAISMIGTVNAATHTFNSQKSSEEINNFFNGANSPLNNGDTVIFKSGTYNNLELSVNKSITLKGDGKVNFVGNRVRTLIILRSNNIDVSGISIKNNYIGITILGNNNKVRNSNIQVSSSYYGAVSIWRASKNNQITGNTLENTGECGSGVYLDYDSSSNKIQSNNINTRFVGIQATKSSKNDISKNNIKGHSGIALISSGSSNKIYDNTIKVTGYNSITKYLYNNPVLTVGGEGIMVAGARSYGIDYLQTENKIHQNTIESSNSRAVHLNIYSRGNTVNNNVLLKGTVINIGSNNVVSNNDNTMADLKITKITKSGNTHRVYIKNIGKKAAGKSILGVYDGKKLIKKVNVKTIAKGKTLELKVPIAAKYKNRIKTFKTDYNNKIKESNDNNNVLKAK
ncbi:MAG: right-handed parallel beta-helix repeat-containing protein [Methanobrevibacter sp.]|nr:right-handed parallel beta-helix repeat-containing protein [Methanobrevibacter sp.]